MAKKEPQKKVDWAKAFQPLIEKYKGKKHPLEYKNAYQLLVGIVLSARDSDKHINTLTPPFFKLYPNMKALATAKVEDLVPLIGKTINSKNKLNWLVEIARKVKTDKGIPTNMEGLVELPGIGRKSANVLMHEMKAKPEGVMVDLHVVRVAERIGITKSQDPKQIEKDIMDAFPQNDWGEVGMAMSFLGREICRPSHPEHDACPVESVCQYAKHHKGEIPKKKKAK